jgi:hypothetical protein
MRKIFGFIASLATLLSTQAASIGEWNAYLAYHDITDIEPAGKLVYVLSSQDLFSYNVNDKSVFAYNKINSLSDTGIAFIAWNNSVKKLLVVYSNYNIDLLDNDNNVENISDYYSKSLTDDKTIFDIYMNGHNAYLSTGFGILKLNMRNAEISETYHLKRKVIACYISGNSIYAKTSEGLFEGNLQENLVNPDNWIKTDKSISFVNENVTTVSTQNGYKEYIVNDKTNKCYWSNQSNQKLQGWTQDESGNRTVIVNEINPDGPHYNAFGFLRYLNGKLYTVPGVDGKNAHIQILEGNQWNIYDESFVSSLGHAYRAHYEIDVDPRDENHVMVASQSGMYEFLNGKFVKNYTNDNSPLQTASTVGNNNKNYVIVLTLKYDKTGTLWLANAISLSNSIFEFKDGTFISHHSESLIDKTNTSLQGMQRMFFDDGGNLWFANNYHVNTCLVCYLPAQDKYIIYDNLINQDGQPINTNHFRNACFDKEGNLWVATNAGPVYLTPEQRNDPSLGFTQYKVPRNDGTNLADYLLNGVNLSCIVIDEANRKWIGTEENGLYLISADNNEEIHHFTTENSNILSNIIRDIAINPTNGEVFIATEKGLCSYMSGTSQVNEKMTKDNVWAYPNPVRPDYTGLISVIGLSYNADVKIVTSNGVLVAEGKSNGGTFTWNGNDLKGQRVASGIYMVQTATQNGESGTVCKIAIVN